VRESKVEAYFCDRIHALGGEVRKLEFIGHRGAPDRLVLLPRASLHRHRWHPLVELKRPKKGAEEHQAREHDRLRAAGFEVYVINSIEAVDRYFPLN
jgi:hypothetical protein